MKVGKKVKVTLISLTAGALLVSIPFVLYLNVLPKVVASPKAHAFVQKTVKKSTQSPQTNQTPENSYYPSHNHTKKTNNQESHSK